MRMSQVNSLVRVLTAAGVSLLFGGAFDCARAEELQASLHPVDAAAKRVDMSMSWGDVLFKPGSKDKEVKILVQIEDATVSSGEPLAQDGGPSIYRHALQIRNVSTCEDTSTDKGLGGELPDVDILSNGSATLEIKSTVRRILSAYHNLLLKNHDPATGGVPGWLPGEFHEAWLARTAAGARPTFGFNRGGFYIRKAQGGEASERLQEPERLQERPASEPAAEPKKYRFPLLRFGQMRPGTEPDYLVDELIPIAGLVVVYGAPKSGKSFWVLDLSLHIALAWEYRDRSVQQGAVVYCAFEGAHGYRKRCEAFRRHHCLTDEDDPPLYVVPGRADLIKDHGALIHDLREQLATAPAVPVKCVILDTLNKSLIGSESKDVDMANYIAAAEHIQTEFNCVVIIVHHHGIDETRPRGHTSLRAAVSAQIKITRDEQNNITAEIEDMRDGPEGAQIVSRLVVVDVGTDRADKPLTSAAVEPVDPGAQRADGKRLPKLTKNQRTMFAILQAAPNGLFANEWSEQAREAGLGLKRRADLTDLRSSLQARKLVVHSSDKWFVAAEYRNCPS